MKDWNKGQLILLVMGILAIAYWGLLKLLYGGIAFAPVFLFGGVLLVLYVCLLHHFHITLAILLPKILYLILIGAIGLSFGVFIIVEAQIIYSATQDSDDRGDVILVLGAGLVDGDQVSTSLQYRLETALEEYEKSPETPIIVSGGQGSDELISEAAAMKAWLMEHGVEESMIWMEDRSTTTSENFTFSMNLMKQHGISSNHVTLITNAFHMHRAKYLGEQYGLTISSSPAGELIIAKPCFYTREFFGMMRAYLLQR